MSDENKKTSRFGETTRRKFLQGASMLAGALAVGSRRALAAEVATVTTALPWITNSQWGGFWIADAEGFYAKEDIKAEFLPGGPNAAAPEQIVAGGGADVGSSNLTPFMSAVTGGTDLVAFATIFQKSGMGFCSLESNPVRQAADLVGKRIGGVPGTQSTINAVLNMNGLPTDYTFVPVGSDIQPLVRKDIDAYVCNVSNQPLVLKSLGVPYVAITNSDLGLPGYANLLYATRRYIDGNRDVLVRWLRATIRGWEKNLDDPALGAKYAVETYGRDLGLKPDHETAQNALFSQLAVSPMTEQKGWGWISKEDLGGRQYQALTAAGIKNLPSVDKVVDLSILEAAYGGKTSLR